MRYGGGEPVVGRGGGGAGEGPHLRVRCPLLRKRGYVGEEVVGAIDLSS